MNNDEIVARLLVLEAFVVTTLGLYLANSRNDPDYQKANALLEMLKNVPAAFSGNVSEVARTASVSYAEHLCSLVASNLRVLRGEGGQSH